MKPVIKLLPDALANQIAAGEVVQRPASVVKELLENSIDAGAKSIRLILKEAGKALIQVIDDGVGMCPSDARMSFERHATSKINVIDDLFNLYSYGFRGEALASIAAVAQVELKTRQAGDAVGTQIIVAGGTFEKQQVITTPVGTSISVKNLFYNVPARRNFLKSNPVELKHCITEFLNVALVHPNLMFSLTHNNHDLYHLQPAATLIERIKAAFTFAQNLRYQEFEEQNTLFSVQGVIGHPEYTRKTRGEQFLYVNDRYIRSSYLHHAVIKAYGNLLNPETHPFYWINLKIPASKVDINIHPTKTEIKFEDEKSIYALLNATVLKAVAMLNGLTEVLDTSFVLPDFRTAPPPASNPDDLPQMETEVTVRQFLNKRPVNINQALTPEQLANASERLYGFRPPASQSTILRLDKRLPLYQKMQTAQNQTFVQINDKFILTTTPESVLIIDQSAAHRRILYDRCYVSALVKALPVQQLLYPIVLDYTPQDLLLVSENLDLLRQLGFDLKIDLDNKLHIFGVSPEIQNGKVTSILEAIIATLQLGIDTPDERRHAIALSIAKNGSISHGQKLSQQEMTELYNNLLACEMPYQCPEGKKILVTLKPEAIEGLFV